MRARDSILSNLEETYRRSYERARDAEDGERMADLDHHYQRDQLILEVLLDLRELLAQSPEAAAGADEGQGESLLDKAERLRNITRLR